MRNFLLWAPLWLGVAGATAQTAPAQTPYTHVERQLVTAATPPEPMAHEITEQLKGQLDLSPTQTTQVYAAALACRQAYQEMLRRRATPGTYEPIAQEQQAIEAAYQARLKPILTPAQAARYQVIQARYRKLRAQIEAEEKSKE
jgi:protein involved in temperature-dependent protein secretion